MINKENSIKVQLGLKNINDKEINEETDTGFGRNDSHVYGGNLMNYL